MSHIFVVPLWHIQVPVTVVILGIITGLTYAILGIGLSLVYRTSRVLNFAQGDMGALPALFVPILVINYHWSYWATIVLALTASVAIGGLIEFLVIRRLRHASRLTALVATVGVSQLLFLAGLLLPKGHSNLIGKSFPTPFRSTITVGTLILGPGQILILIVVPLVTIGLTVFLRRSRLGRASRAAAENADAAALTGVAIHRVALAMWAMAGLLAGVSALLVGPTRPIAISQALGPDLMLRALGAAMLGGLLSLPLVFAGGIAIGIIEALSLWNYPRGGTLEVVIFIVILFSLLLKRGLGQLARGDEGSSWSLAGNLRPLSPALGAMQAVRRARVIALGVLLVGAAALPSLLTSAQMFNVTSVVVFALIGLSLVVLTGYAGQVSLGQFAFVAIGAALGGRIHQLGLPFVAALAAVAVVGGLVAIVVGLPALRIRGLFLAVTTLGFSVAIAAWLFNQPWINPSNGSGSLSIPRPRIGGLSFESETHYYWLCLVALVAGAVLVRLLRRSGLGRGMIACRDNESAAASLSISPRMTKLAAFVIAGMIASLAGCLYGGLVVDFSYNPSSTFGASQSLSLVIMAVLGGVTSIAGVVIGAIWVRGIPAILGEKFGILTSGLGLIVILILAPGGLASVAFRIRDWAAEQISRRPRSTEPQPVVPATVATRPLVPRDGDARPPAIEAAGITVRYGGVVALNGVTIHAQPGEILGLMGTNGAGKTTLFDVVSGRLRPNAGEVRFDGSDVTSWPPHRRARAGFGRTFQQARLFDGLTLVEAITLAHERAPDQATDHRGKGRGRAHEILEMLGLSNHAHRYAGELSTGTRRLGELACVTALGSRLLLLDEPTAGFVPAEVEEFCQALRSLRAHLAATVIVIDHDVPMMATLVDRLYVLEAGNVLAEGPPTILQDDPRVVATYLGGRPSSDLASVPPPGDLDGTS